MKNVLPCLIAIFLIGLGITPTAAAVPPAPVSYTIHIDPNDLSGLSVEMRFQNSPTSLRIAMAAHPEYDDHYWRYIEKVSAVSAGRSLIVTKTEDAVWRVDGARRDIVITYRLRFPPQENPERDAWKPFLTPTGGMVGDLHCLMYILGGESRPATLTLDMPDGWKAASGLEPTRDPKIFTGSTELMLDAPVMVGQFDEWDFRVGNVPHKIVIWSPPDAARFDPKPVVDGVRKLAEQAIKTFGPPPYRRYAFLFQNGGSAALEHLSSVNIGHSFAGPIGGLFEEVAHEYFHAWNLMDVKPQERVGLRYKFAPPTGVLWWNEGATIYFSDLLVRGAGLPMSESGRVKHLETAITRYFSSPGYVSLSAEQASRGDTDPLAMGELFASTHLQGELLATVLDIKIQNETARRRDLTDVMRALSKRFDSSRGIANSDIEKAMMQVCPTCGVHQFFKDHIYGASQIDFDRYLSLIGMRAEVSRSPALDREGKPAVDLRIGPLQGEPEAAFKIRVTNPQSAWGRAGLHTGDQLLTVDGRSVSSWPDLRAWLQQIKIGDVGRLEIIHEGGRRVVQVPITGYDTPTVRISELPNATPKQLRSRRAWLIGKPESAAR